MSNIQKFIAEFYSCTNGIKEYYKSLKKRLENDKAKGGKYADYIQRNMSTIGTFYNDTERIIAKADHENANLKMELMFYKHSYKKLEEEYVRLLELTSNTDFDLFSEHMKVKNINSENHAN